MPYANNQGVKIYYEVEGQGPPIILAHGGMGNMSYWRGYHYVEPLKEHYTVVLYDARGHGESDKPYTSAEYDYKLMVDDVIAVMDTLQLEKAHFWGYSMGGYTGFGLAKHYEQRLYSLIVGGSTPYSEEENKEEHEGMELLRQMFRRGVAEGRDVMIAAWRDLFGPITPQSEARLRIVDMRAMVASLEGSAPNLTDLLPKFTIPCFVYAGEADEPACSLSREYVKQIPQGTFVSFPGFNHTSIGPETDLIMPYVLKFLQTIPAA